MWRRIIRRINLVLENERASRKLTKSIEKYSIHPTALIYDSQNVLLAEKTIITEYVIIRSPQAKIEIGLNSVVGPYSILLGGENGITIGQNVMIAPHCVFAAGVHEYRNLQVPMRFAGSFSNGPIIVEDDVWIGANCTISDNVKIGKGAIVSANSFVNENVEPYDIVGGVPAKKISSRLKYQ